MSFRNKMRKLFEQSLFIHRKIAARYGKYVRVYSVGLEIREARAATLELMSREILLYGVEGNAAELGGVCQVNCVRSFFPYATLGNLSA